MRYLLVPFVALALLAAAPSHAALDDPTIVAIFDAANTYDIDTGNLALKKSHTTSVRDLAQQFINDHTAVRQQGRDLAKKLGVTPTAPKDNPVGAHHEKALKELRGKSGADFDKAYAAEEVRYHQEVIDALNSTLVPAIQNAELKAFVLTIVPAFQGHLEAAKHLESEVGAPAAGH